MLRAPFTSRLQYIHTLDEALNSLNVLLGGLKKT
ncbi:conserved hypothetical protein [Xenorhabdus nematophila F1]|uniref:Uncharacterized protein n=1 Tax=Xenorhabdus nematophila (strain ATCC 19061 / DSM 3370 / CCUG 14189 / LMG 1036 / NCIMB 9965 / AN6) TaxID=406817 RepID=D3VB77_XENNA|nr:hypothetical protein XNC1_1453 [Xenorhabdus nematophila ATCC 19061]CCW31147.1 conserved hypothetical protein [Xenorhabdus nematophila F1]CEK22409.1 hypothetical protein XNC2_1415 [Xenorhabdus nematophila AN6/1]